MGGVWPAPPARAFVGRSAPLAVLDRALDEALAGRPRAVLVEGDAGIGKSRLAAEVLEHARRRGALVLVGRCNESLRIPYFPLAGAMAPLGDELGDAIALIDPVVAPTVERLETTADDDRPAAPLVAACQAVVAAARRRPVVVLIEDLHWADRHSLHLLEQLVAAALDAGTTAPTAILFVATLRSPGAEAAHTAERLRREVAVRSIHLHGMSELELNELLTALGPARPSRQLLAAMAQATDGNPLAVRTLLDRLTTTGGVAVRDGELTSTVGDLISLPGGLDDELRRRLDGVSAPCRRLLTRAAFLGDGSLLSDLEACASAPDDDPDRLVDEAEDAGLLHDDGERYRFDHPRLCQVLYRQPEGRARQRLHLQLADELESCHGHDLRRAVEIADHLRRAGRGVDPERLARWSMAAGERAFAVAAWGTAARYFDDALAAGEGRFARLERARLELRSGIGHFRDHDLHAAEERLLAAIADARDGCDHGMWGTAALLLTRARMTIGPGSVGARIDTSELEDVLAATDRTAPRTGEILGLLAEVHFHAFDFDEGQVLLDEARRIARRHGDDALSTGVELAAGLQHLGRLELDAAATAFRSSADHGRRLGDPWQRVWGVGRLPLVESIRGEMSAAAGHAAEAATIAADNHDWAEHALASACAMQISVARGDFAAAEAAGSVAVQMYRRSDYAFVPALIYPAFAAARALRGDVAGANEALDDWAAVGGQGLAPYRLLVAASTLDPASLAEERPFRPVGGRPVNLFTLPVVCAQVEVAALTGDVDLLADAYEPLAAIHRVGVRWCLGWPLLVSRLLAVADRCLARSDSAAQWCRIATAEARQAGSASELARLAMERALLAAAGGEDLSASTAAGDAARAFDDLGMLPSLLAAHRLGGRPAGDDRVVRTILFTDLVGSTALNIRTGDAGYLALLERHNAILRGVLRRFDGVEIKHTGDGIGAWFASSAAACECALAMRDDLADHNASHPESPLGVRFGLASGAPIPHEGDLFGVVMSLASRLCDQAAPAQVLVSEAVASAAGNRRLSFRPLAPLPLKGFPGAVPVFAVETGTR